MRGPSMGMRILEALTREQVAHLLNTVLGMWEAQGMTKILGALDEDVASTLTRLFQPGAVSEKRIVSGDKQLEEWRGLWQHWEEIVSELGEGEGRYVEREHHWEEPTFAAVDFVYDLERVAEQMLPLLESVYEIGDEGDELFEGALTDIENGIQAYPDWMGVQESDCTLGSQTSRCVLKWGWLGTGSAADFISWLTERQHRMSVVELDPGATIDFFRSLPDEDCRQVYSALIARREELAWHDELESTGSHWHQVYYGFRKTYDPDGYVEDCQELLHQDWRYGFPVIERMASAGRTAEAERIAEETMGSLLKAKWLPEETLLLSVLSGGFFLRFPREEVIRLLGQWRSLAEELNNKERAESLRFQQVSWEAPSDWASIAECLHALRGLSFTQTAERLVDQWKKHALRAHLIWGEDRRGNSEDCWVMWLLDEAMSEAPDGERFLSKADQWLQTMIETKEGGIGSEKGLLSILTCDMMHFHEPAARYRLLRAVLCGDDDGSKEWTLNRRTWLQRMGAEQLSPFVIQCWRIHLPHMMPDPGRASSLYTHHAQWLAALNELDPSACRKVILQWKDAYKRRRNLWKAIQEQGLAV
jgi:hypothetical protein